MGNSEEVRRCPPITTVGLRCGSGFGTCVGSFEGAEAADSVGDSITCLAGVLGTFEN